MNNKMNPESSANTVTRMQRTLFSSLCCISLFFLLAGCGTTPNKTTPPTISIPPQEALCIGVECREQPKTAEEFLPIFAEQLQHYNTIAASLRPDNAVQGFDAIVVNMDRTKARKVQANGVLTNISVEEADTYKQTVGYDTEFIFPANDDERKFVVLTLNEESLKNPENFEKYAHIGTYDLFITYVHELFHNYEQRKRLLPSDAANMEKNEYLEEVPARATRAVILQQLLNAFTFPEQRTEFIQRAAATYRDYQTKYPTDAANTHLRDKLEGTAYYLELVSSLQIWYPNLKTTEDFVRAYGVIVPKVDMQERAGAINEGYIIGGLAGLLLDALEVDWKTTVVNEPDKTPLDLLAEYFDGKISVSDIVVPDEALLEEYKNLNKKTLSPAELDLQAQEMLPLLKDVKSQSEAAYQEFLEQLQTTSPELIERIQVLMEEEKNTSKKSN